MKLLKTSLITTAVLAALSTSAIAVELDGLMTVKPKVEARVPLLDEYGNVIIDPETGEPVLSRRPKYIGGSYFSMGANTPNNSVSQESGPAGGITLGEHQRYILSPDEPHPAGHPLALYGAGTGYSSAPTEASTAMAGFKFFGVNTYLSTSPIAHPTGDTKEAPSASVDAEGNLSVYLSAWEVMWNGSVFEQGPRTTGTEFVPAMGTYDYDTGDYTIEWPSTIVGGPFGGVTGWWHLEGTILADPATASAFAEPQSLNVKSQGNGFTVSISLTDPNGNVIPATSINDGVMISSVSSVEVPEGEITENIAGRLIDGDTLIVAFDDPATGNRQDIIAAVTDVTDGSSVAVCASGKARDADGILRPFEGCDNITIRNKGNR